MTRNLPEDASLTQWLVARSERRLDAADLARAALHVLDWVGCAAAGRNTPAGRALAATARATGAGKAAGLDAPGLSPAAAAFLNGGLGNVLEMDDIHRSSILHPGPVVIPAALAAAQTVGADSATFLRGVICGYEAMIRIGAALGPRHYALWHNTSTAGPFGAAMAAAQIMGLSETQTVWALGNAGTQASGPWRCRHEDVMTKQLHTARAAQSGYLAAALAGEDFTGPARILEGEQGFFAAMAPDGRPDAIRDQPDAAWKIWDTSFKPWPACRHVHPTIDAACAVHASGIDIRKIRSVRIETYADALRFCDRPAPTNPAQARFSLHHAAAVALRDGPPWLAAFEPEAIASVAPLRRLCRVSEASSWSAAYPQRYGAALSVTLRDGTVHHVEKPDALGDPDNPVDAQRIAQKTRGLCTSAGWTPDRIEAVVAATLGLARGGALAALASGLATTDSATKRAAE
ncbi:MAG: MmgE/PrpD family protein [Pseudomonadota bacterium]